MYEKSIIVKCSQEYKDKVKKMAADKSMDVSAFIKHLIANEEKK